MITCPHCRALFSQPLEEFVSDAILDVQRIVARNYHVQVSGLWGPRRTRTRAEARAVAMAICRDVLNARVVDIADCFNRGHPEVSRATKAVSEKRHTDADFSARYSFIEHLCRKARKEAT